MKVSIELIEDKAKEQVTIECAEITKDIKSIESYVLAKGSEISGCIDNRIYQIKLEDVFYFEAIGEKVFAYTIDNVYEMKSRLYELEDAYGDKNFVRCSKSFVINLIKLDGISPELNGRFIAHMKNGEKVIVSRMYVKNLKNAVMGGK